MLAKGSKRNRYCGNAPGFSLRSRRKLRHTEWIGSLRFQSLKQSFVLTATAKQPKRGIFYREELRIRLRHMQFALGLLGFCGYKEAFLIAGANEAGIAEVRIFGGIERPFQLSRGMEAQELGRDELARAANVADRLKIIDKEGIDWRRLRRGIDALNNGLAERNLQDSRLHQFVRALEGLFKPAKGSSNCAVRS